MTFSKLTRFTAVIGALSIASVDRISPTYAINLHEHGGASGIFSAMMEIENGEETREKERQEARDRKKKQNEEAEREHQALIQQEEEEEAAKEKAAIDSA
jgi:hypothetical protein|tara:strand:+ start:66 stop:365 length:300 start_codon:yes stop_codon:yes gene_type:complete